MCNQRNKTWNNEDNVFAYKIGQMFMVLISIREGAVTLTCAPRDVKINKAFQEGQVVSGVRKYSQAFTPVILLSGLPSQRDNP